VLLAPSIMNIAASPLRHLSQSAEDYEPIFVDLAKADVAVLTGVANAPRGEIALAGFEAILDEDETPKEPVTFLGEELDTCVLRTGVIGWTKKVLAQLDAVDVVPGRQVLVADVYDYLWLFAPTERLEGMATWYYGGDDGFDGAELVLVPLCPLIESARQAKLEVIAEKGWVLEEVIRTDLFILAQRSN